MRPIGGLGIVGLLLTAVAGTLRAESFSIEEPSGDSRVFLVTARMTGTGRLETEVSKDKPKPLPLSIDATHRYLERRLPGAGRDAEAFRSLRNYQQAEASIEVEKTRSSLRLNEGRRTIVALGRREGVTHYCPGSLVTRSDLSLLTMPGDSLTLLALVPRTKVESGEKWTPDSWVMQYLSGVDAVTKSDLTCEVGVATAEAVTVKFSGTLEGAIVGATTKITITGTYRYDRKANYISRVELEQKEERSVGAVSPGLNVTAKVVLERSPASAPGPLTETAAEAIPLEPDVKQLMLQYETPWGVRLIHDRDWHLFHDTAEVAVLRLLDKGSLVAQCNLRKIAPAAAGQHASEETFQADIRKVLGEQFKAITNAEEVKSDDGRFLYRVTATGERKAPDGNAIKIVPMHWIYYLCAAPSGQQCALVFAVDTEHLERLGNRDLTMVKSLQIVNREPTKAP